MGKLDAAARNKLAKTQFALPEQKKYPLPDAAHVRNAAARLAQERKAGKISPSDYSRARAAIRRAAKRYGIHSELSDTVGSYGPGMQKSVSVRAQLGAGGHLHVRHMSEDGSQWVEALTDGTWKLRDVRPLRQGEEVEPASVGVRLVGPPNWKDGTPKTLVWVQLAEVGAWKGHPAGPFEMTSTTFSEIVSNFAKRGLPVAFDMDHCSEQDPTSGSIPEKGAPAQGWIHKLANRAQAGLWGLVEWLDYAREGIKDGKFAFVSPAIRFGSKDPVTGTSIGARLTSAAITNSPFLNHLQGLIAARDGGTQTQAYPLPDYQIKGGTKTLLVQMDSRGEGALAHKPHEYMPAVKRALGMHELCMSQECADKLEQLRDHVEACGDAEGLHEGIDLSQYTRPLKQLVDAQPGDTWGEVFDAVESLIQAAIEQHEIEYHGASEMAADDDGGDDDGAAMHDQGAGSSATTNRDGKTMATESADEIKTLNDKIAARDALLTSKDTEIKTLNDKLTEQSAQLKALGEQVKVLTEAEEKRVLSERHDLYKEKASLDAMTAVYRSDRALFDKEYPYVDPSKRHLMTMHATKREETSPQTGDNSSTGGRVLDLSETARLLAAEKGMPLADAQALVFAAAQKFAK